MSSCLSNWDNANHPESRSCLLYLKTVHVTELTVAFGENILWANQCKLEKYKDLQEQHVKKRLDNQYIYIYIYFFFCC